MRDSTASQTFTIAVPSAGALSDWLRPAPREREWFLLSLAAAFFVHGFAAWGMPNLAPARLPSVVEPPMEVVDIDLPKPESPVLVESPNVEEPQTAPAAARPPPALRAPSTSDPPPSSAAQAGAVLTQQPDLNEPVDFTNGFVTGGAVSYAGGATLAGGTSASAVHGRPAPSGVPGGTGSAPPAPVAPPPKGPDRSKPPALAGSSQWRCPFPAEADDQGIDHAVVTLKVGVDAAGGVTSVSVVSDAGHGFGREARQCAMGKRWTAAVDPNGSPVSGTAVVNVRFDR